MIRILVTGSEGQLGKCIQKTAANFPDFEFVFHSSKTFDITDAERIAQVFSNEHFDYCINCAAYTDVEQAEKTPELAYAINAEAVRHLSLACSEFMVILIHISTDYVFDGQKEVPYKTSDKTNPLNEYGRSKLKGEQHIQKNLKEHFIVRTSWLYSEYGKNFYKTIFEKAKSNKVLEITDEQTGCPTNGNNLAVYILNLINTNSNAFGTQHFTDGEPMTWYDFANKIVKENNFDCKVVPKKYITVAERPLYSVLEIGA